ncbi:hypothetical protein P389DRAFT_168654 [Cystobasidium minutum MCA 4210]|uniref:uncharacterized protein n=1 Tax=Cystobasidium minutum MCA 4210 TaxID=1397322 RepID=UPI0034CFC4DB|eukprot:jgi/Rhomi1/168654/fgenesh1_kg.3_\
MAAHTTDHPAIASNTATVQPPVTSVTGETATAHPGPINSTDLENVSHAPTDSSFVTAPMEKPHPHVDTANVQPAHQDSATAATVVPTASTTAARKASGHAAEPSSAISATSGGLASALLVSGHNVSKTDAKHLKQEIKNEKTVVQNLTLEEKREATSIKAALLNVKSLIKDQERCRKAELAAEKKHRARVTKQAKANKVFLKAQEALTEATARTETAKAELEGATKAHVAAQQAATEAERKAEQLRTEKGQHDVDREAKKGAALAKVGDAEKTLAESGFKKRFLCF